MPRVPEVFNLKPTIRPRVSSIPISIDVGQHLADQFIANLAAAAFFALALKLSFVNMIPTALRLGAGCGISILVSVLGLRGLGLLVSDSFTLLPFTWQNVSEPTAYRSAKAGCGSLREHIGHVRGCPSDLRKCRRKARVGRE